MARPASRLEIAGRPAPDWRDGLAIDARGKIIGDERNVLLALRTAPELRELVRYNDFALAVEFARSPPWREATPGGPWSADDDTSLVAYLQENEVAVRGKNIVADCIGLVAKDNRVHPVRDYLAALVWDGNARADVWLEAYLGAQGDSRYLAAVGRCWLISAVARVESPGSQADHVLVLEGPQGAGKSSAARALATRPAWFADNIGDLGNKDSALQLLGKWIVELSELNAIRRGELESVKGYISRTQDVFRPPYERRAVTVPRQTVFIGTTNEHEYLRDPTGNRRFWPVRCGLIDLVALERERDQLWAEAVALFIAGTPWHLPRELEEIAGAQQRERVHVTEIEASVAEYLDRCVDDKRYEITTRDIFRGALGIDESTSHLYASETKRLGPDLAAAITRCGGWIREGRAGRPGNRRTKYRWNGDRI